MVLKSSAAPGTIITFSSFTWPDRLLGHKVLNHARMPRVSVTPVMKTGVLLGRTPAGTAPASMLPAGMLRRGSDMLTDMRLLAASPEAVGSKESETVAMGLGCPLGCWGLFRRATSEGYASLHSWLLDAGCTEVRISRGARWVGRWASSGRGGQATQDVLALLHTAAFAIFFAERALLSSRKRAG